MNGIVVGVSSSAAGRAAVDFALQQAALRDLPLTAVRVFDIPSHGSYYSVGAALRATDPEFERSELELARAAVRDAVARVPEAAGGKTSALATMGRVPEVLLEAGKDAALLVVGARGVGALTRIVHLGSVTSSVLHSAHVPVAVVPDQVGSGDPSRIVVGVDGSPTSLLALRWAVEQARLSGSILVPLGVTDSGRHAGGSDEAARQSLAAAARQAGAGDGQPVTVEPAVRHGHAAEELLAAAEGAGLLVLGSRGRGGFSRLLVGSTSTQCAGHATCPVVVVRS